MKIKIDFVTNSSSTNFSFVFKGPKCKKSLIDAIWNHRDIFTLSYYLDENYNWQCKAQDIVEDIEKCIKQSLGKDEWDSVKIVTLDNKIEEIEERIASEKQRYEREEEKEEYWRKFTLGYIKDMEKVKRKLVKAKERGFENFFEMEWGDNHGQVAGGETGHSMDYNAGKVKIDSDDLIVFSESCH